METINSSFPQSLQGQIDDFFSKVSDPDNVLNIEDLFIQAHSIKGVALFYGCSYLKMIFADIENVIGKYKSFLDDTSEKLVASYISDKKETIYNYINNYDDSTTAETISNADQYVFRRIRMYRFVINNTDITYFRNIITAIKDVVLITRATKWKRSIQLVFLSNLEYRQLKLLFSCYNGRLCPLKIGSLSLSSLLKPNLIADMCKYCSSKVEPSGTFFNKKDLLCSLYNGIHNLAVENNVFVHLKIKSRRILVHKDMIKIALIPVLEILKNAFSHGSLHKKELFIKVTIALDKSNFVVRIFNKGDKINTKAIVCNAVEKNLVSKETVRKMNRVERMNLIYTKFLSSAACPTSCHGHGIGLYAAKKIVEENKGKLILKNHFRGLEFKIVLPCKETQTA